MSTTTMLQLVQQATAEMGLSVPTSVAGNTNIDVVQQLALLNAVGYELIREYDWEAKNKIYTFSTSVVTTTGTLTSGSAVITGIPSTASLSTLFQVVGIGVNNASYVDSVDSGTQVTMSQVATSSGTGVTLTFSKVKYVMPSDYDRQIDRTHWDKTQHWEMLGPETAQQWEWLTSGFISTGPRVRYRIFGDYFQIWPALGVSHQLGFEYVANSWAATTAGVAKTAFTVDTDTCIFPDRLMVLGLKMKYFNIKGMSIGAPGIKGTLADDYDRQLSIAQAADAGSPLLSMNPRQSNVLINWSNLPDSGFGT